MEQPENPVLSRKTLGCTVSDRRQASRAVLFLLAGLAILFGCHPAAAGVKGEMPLHVFCGTGDHLWVRDREPVDSPASIDAMFEWMAKTYGIKRMYWRGGQTHIWDQSYKVGEEAPNSYDWAMGWKHHLYNDLKINEAAVAAAKRNGMEIFLYTGLFEHGVQPDVGIVAPYPFEDRLRMEHPEWCPVDRWGERRSPGPIAFCYPEARKALIDRYVHHVNTYGYDGINFYTYVENLGLRYLDEFGFNQPIVDAFNRHYPDVDLRSATLTLAQKTCWYECRGTFLTQFLRELHAALSVSGKKLSIILDAEEPRYPQPWWGHTIPGTGNTYFDLDTWIDEGLVDEFWVQLGAAASQKAVLDDLLVRCKGKGVKLTFRTPNPYDAGWDPYVEAGVTPVACITWARNGIERLTLDPTSADTLRSPDWRLRAQTLADVAEGRLKIASATLAPLASDSHVLVRRRLMHALAALADSAQIPVLEAALTDSESSVRMAAAGALVAVHGPNSPECVLVALGKNHHFQFKLACIDALSAVGADALPPILKGLESSTPAVREACVRTLYRLGKSGLHQDVYAPLRGAMLDKHEDSVVRYWAIDGLLGLRLEFSAAQCGRLAEDWMALVDTEESTTVQLHAAEALSHMPSLIADGQKIAAIAKLTQLLHQYGDDSTRSDAAFGWRVVGNALLAYGAHGRAPLSAALQQRDDAWLAWNAYRVLHVQQKRTGDFNLVDEADAIAAHAKFAPPFPGYRPW
jgi:HEAT repeat protein